MEYENEIVTRSAPRWAWEIIDNALYANSETQEALKAMMFASENSDLDGLAR